MSEMWPGVSGKAPRASGGVVWVATVVFSEVLLPEPLRHESVRSRATVTQAQRPIVKHFSKHAEQPLFRKKNKATVSVVFFFISLAE